LSTTDWSCVSLLAHDMLNCWRGGKQVFLCGNGGSAGNAIHLANDFLFGVARKTGAGMKVQALSANAAVVTCLANDVGYERIFAQRCACHRAGEGDGRQILCSTGLQWWEMQGSRRFGHSFSGGRHANRRRFAASRWAYVDAVAIRKPAESLIPRSSWKRS